MKTDRHTSAHFSASAATESALLLSLKKIVGWPDFVEQSATNSELRDAMDGKGSTFRFRPCGRNDGSDEAKGDVHRRSAHRDTVLEGMRGNPGVRRTRVCP